MNWHKSSYSMSNGQCVEIGTGMHKATASARADGCVEAGPCACGGDVLVHDTKHCKDPDRCTQKLAFSRETWAGFTGAVKAGQFTLPL